MVNTIATTDKLNTTQGNHSGDKTNHQDQLTTPTNFSTTKINRRHPKKPIPVDWL